jgi:hypothetical protein
VALAIGHRFESPPPDAARTEETSRSRHNGTPHATSRHSRRQMLQAGKPGRQTPTEGDPPVALALQRTASPTQWLKNPNARSLCRETLLLHWLRKGLLFAQTSLKIQIRFGLLLALTFLLS